METKLGAGTAETLACAGGHFQCFYFLDEPCQYGNGDHLRDFFAGLEFDGGATEVRHEDENFAAIAGIDHASSSGDTLRRNGRAVADQQAERSAGGGMARLNGDAGADSDCGLGSQENEFECKEVVSEVLAGVCNGGDASTGFE